MSRQASVGVAVRYQDCWMCKLVVHKGDHVIRIKREAEGTQQRYVTAMVCLDCGIAIADAAAEFVEAHR